MCYTSNVVKRDGGGGGGGSADLVQTHLKFWSAPTKSMRADGGEQLSDQLLHLPHTAPAPTTFIILFYCWRPLSFFLSFFFFSVSPRSFPLWQAELSLIVSFMTDTEWGLALIQGRPCTAIFMVSFHLTCWCVVVTHLTQTIQHAEVVVVVVGAVERHSWEWTETKFLHTPIFNFQ